MHILLLAPMALATDTWTPIRTGVDYLHRTTGDPQDIYAVRVDLSVPNVGLHASADSGGERGVTVSTFARNVNALVAINADWNDGYTPVGMAISDGWTWHGHIPDDALSGQWGYLGCTATKDCTIGSELPLNQAWWFGSPHLPPYRFFQAVGANGILLLKDGVPWSGCYDSAQNPRSAVCMEADGVHMWLVVIDGRSSRADGMTCDQTRQLMQELGCYDAAMLDGGGSSTLVIENDIKNSPSDGAERTVSNHLGVIYSDTMDGRCTVSSGKWCEGTVISACQGGRYLGNGDCAVYGAGCQEDGDYAFCVDYRCPGGDGNGEQCIDATQFNYCSDGQYSSGDCGAFGLLCGSDAGGTGCMDPRCAAGPHSSFCTDGGLVGACTDGAYAEAGCGAGTHCDADAAGAFCADDRCPTGGTACTGDVFTSCARGVYAEVDCALLGNICDASLGGCVGVDSDSPVVLDDSAGVGAPGRATALGELGGCGCDAGRGAGVSTVILTILGLVRRRRRAGPGRTR